MQHSPQEIKTRLDRVVDTDGNVLDMPAVLEAVTILERLPITKEALEKTRLGKTINLLRKKTKNEELAKRAKGLVKKWQKLVMNHLETLRNADSPINGSGLSSPQINGTVRDPEKPASPSVDRAGKSKILEGKKRGVKRKRNSCSSSENSPVVFSKSDDCESHPGTPNSGVLPQIKDIHNQGNISTVSPSQPPTPQSGDKSTLSLQSPEESNILSVDSGIESQLSVKTLDELNIESGVATTESNWNDQSSDVPENLPCSSQKMHENVTDTGEGVSLQFYKTSSGYNKSNSVSSSHDDDTTEVNILSDHPVEHEIPTSPVAREFVLDVNVQANGVTGRFGDDGSWYDWTEVMPSSDGALQVLPYVILE
ncbi:mediator of RNA polymerase II transcription subunit 26-like [Stylophora pistillata]|uniref:Mediator of RNA polymerase II transcription subunit 26 n=1 Tax=Stylophora pistillata TaxID=50429 RepID=A0A2B4SHF1_STYPI|nr:mediator of RNA polymerase II transcription subunit 26-like [Stylophora pistillata]PFX28018.1 Mediator of RNA polymerase II transcription subunit 26 [Stylophora pistillata]